MPCVGRSGPRAWALVGARSSCWRRPADGSFFFFLYARRSQIPVRRLGRTGTPTRVGEAGRESPASSLSLGVRAPTFATTRPPLPPPPPQVDQMAPESSRPDVHGVVLGTGGRVKVPGSLPASHRWAPLSSAVILSPKIGLFCHQVSADTVSFGVCRRGLWVSGCTRGSGPVGRQLAPGSAFAAGAACLGLCAGSCVVCLADPARGAASGRPEGGGARRCGSLALCSPLRAPGGGWDDPCPVGSVPRVSRSPLGVVGCSRLRCEVVGRRGGGCR